MKLPSSRSAAIILLILILFIPPIHQVTALEGPRTMVERVEFPMPRFVNLGGFDLVEMDGLVYLASEGQPFLPVKPLTFTLDAGSRVLNVTVHISYEELPDRYTIPPAPKPKVLGNLSAREFTEPDPVIYSMNAPFPPAPYTYREFNGLDPDTLKPVKYVVVYLYPLRYVPATGELYFARNATVELTYEQASPIPLQNDLDLLIIAPPEFYPQAEQLASARNASGIATAIATLDWIYANYAGVDNPEKIRNCIKDYRLNHGIEFVLLFGDADVVPARLAYIPDGYDDSDDPAYTGDGSFVETDLYYADLDGTWNADGDSFWGEVPDDGIDAVPDVFVGRLPASNAAEAQVLVDKVLAYQPDNAWFMTYLMLGTDTFGNQEGEYLKDYIISNFVPDTFTVKRLYETWGTLTVSSAFQEIDKGYGFINFAGHGVPEGWSFGNAGGFYDRNDAYSQTNANTSVIFTMACSTSRFYDTDSIAEVFLLNPNGGAIAYFGSTRIAWGYTGTAITAGLAGEIDWRFSEALFYYLDSLTPEPYLGRIWGKAETDYVLNHPPTSSPYDWKTVAEYGSPMGDPSLLVQGTGSPPPGQAFSLYGRVYDASSGSGVADALVSLYTQDGATLIGSTYTDAQGNYYLEGEGYDAGLIRVERAGYYVREKEVALGANTRADVALVPLLNQEILIVVDDDGANRVSDGVWPDEIEAVLDSMGISYFTWYESEYGRPPLQALQDAGIGVIWHVGTYYGSAVDPADAETLIQFVQSGGNLILEGEDIANEHQADAFMLNVAHASLVMDDAGIYTLEVTNPEHPVAWSLPATFDFGLPPPYPDGVSPENGGVEIIAYQGDSSAVVAYDGWPAGEGRTVYFAFPFHYLGSGERATLIENSVKWIAGVTSPRLDVWPEKGVAVPGVLNAFFLDGYGFQAGQGLWFYAGSWDEALGRVGLGTPEDTALTATTTPMGAIPPYAFVRLDGSVLRPPFLGVATTQSSPVLSERGHAVVGSVADLSAVPYFTTEPGTVSAGQTIRVAGENFTPDGTVEIYWNGPDTLLTTVQADGSGRIDVQVVVPESPAGNATLLAYDVSKGLLALNRFDGDRLWLPFTVLPRIELVGSSIRGLAGESFELTIHGLSYLNQGASSTAYLQGHIDPNSLVLGGVTLVHEAVDGPSTVACQLPEDLPATGFVQVTAGWRAGAYNDVATGMIPVSRPELPAGASFSQDGNTREVGHVGDEFEVYGWNFEWLEPVEVWFDNVKIGVIDPDPNGFIQARFTVPEVPAGDHEVRLVQSAEQATLIYSVVPKMWINASGLEVEPGDWVRIYAYGLDTSTVYTPLESSTEILPNTEFNLIEGVRVGSSSIAPNGMGTIVLDYRTFYDPSSYWAGDPVVVALSGMEDSYLAVASPGLRKRPLPLIVLHNVSLVGPRSLAAGRDVWVPTENGLVRVSMRGEPMVYDVDAVLVAERRGRVWFSTPDSRLGMLDLREGTVKYWELPGNVIDLTLDRRGNAWFTYPTGYGTVDSRLLNLELFPLGSEPKGIAVDRYGNVWVALPQEQSILKRDPSTGEEQTFPLAHAPEWLISDRYGNVWFTSGQLLGRLNDEAYWNAGVELGRPSIDRRGNIWLAADGKVLRFSEGVWTAFEIEGVTWLSAGTRDVWLLVDGKLASFSIRRGAVQVYEVPPMSSLSAARFGTSIYVLDYGHNALVEISEGVAVHRIPYRAYGMALDRDGNVWLASYGGLLKFDGASFARITASPTYAVSVDRRGNVWFSGRGYVFMYDQRRGTVQAYDAGGVRAGMLALSRRGLWLVEGQEVYFLSTRANGTTARVTLRSEALAVAPDRRGDLWVAMADGLARISLSDFSVEYVDVAGVYAVDHARNLVYTMKDVTVSEGRRVAVMYYTPGTAASLFVERRGGMLVGTLEGIFYFIDFRARI